MESVSLEIKKKIILGYLDNQPDKKIAYDLNVPLETVTLVLSEWEGGYSGIFTNEYELSSELKELAKIMKDKDLTIQDLSTGYLYYQLLYGSDQDLILKLIRELKDYPEEKRSELYSTAQKLIKFAKYKNIEFVDIPVALEEMVEKGKVLNRGIKELDAKLKTLNKELEEIVNKKQEFLEELKTLAKESELAKNLKAKLQELNIMESKLLDFMETISHSKYSIENLELLLTTVKKLRENDLDIDQFLKLGDYLNKLIEIGLSVSYLKTLASELEAKGIDFSTYVSESNKYIKSKVDYLKEIEDLKKEHKSMESQIRSMKAEIKDFLKKVKPKMK